MIHGNQLFPECVGIGSLGGPGYQTDIRSSDNGFEVRSSAWSDSQTGGGFGPHVYGGVSRVRYEINQPLSDRDEFSDLWKMFWTTSGRAYGFRFRDPMDWSTTPSNSSPPNIFNITHYTQMATQVGTERSYQLVKAYHDGTAEGGFFIRNITRPMRPGVDLDAVLVIFPLGGPPSVTTGSPIWVDGIDFGTDYDTGQIRVYNHQPTINPGSLILGCFTFQVPGHFDSDSMKAALPGFSDNAQLNRMPLSEVPHDTHRGEGESYHGGWVELDSAALTKYAPLWMQPNPIYHLDPGIGHFQQLKDLPNGTSVWMPDPTNPATWPEGVPAPPEIAPLGGPWIVLWNDGAENVLLTDHNGVTLAALGSGLQSQHSVELFLVDPNAAPGQQWEVF